MIYVAYFIFIIYIKSGWQNISVVELDQKNVFKNKISIVIAFKNESENLLNILQSIENQSISKDLFEVICINDHSNDNSVETIETYCLKSKLDLSILNASNHGKKNALTTAILASKNEIIVCTDADCIVSKDWVRNWLNYFENEQINLGFGLVTFTNKSNFLSAINTIEFASLVGSGAGTFSKKMPTMCNGANLAYRKKIFNQLNGFENIKKNLSGDDEFLMHKFYKSEPNSVGFLKSKTAIVKTTTARNGKEFYHQRLRWASKWENYQLPHVKAIALLVFMTNASTIGCFFDIIFAYTSYKLSIFCIFQCVRFIIEYRFLHSILLFMDKKLNLSAFMFLYLFYPFYVVFFGIGGRFLNYKWKNNKKNE